MTAEAHPSPTTTPAEREVAYLFSEIFHQSANRGLYAYRLLVSRYLPWIARGLVHRARRRGTSWAGIGRILGFSRQAVQKRFDREVSLANMLPPTLPMKTASADREYQDLLTRLRHMREHADARVTGELVPW